MSERLSLSLIYPPQHSARALQPEAVASLARSIRRIGLRTPITVRAVTRTRDGRPADAWEIVAGRHRVEAARSLGWTEIDAIVTDANEADARLWEIAENLHRADLTVAERAEHIAEWIRITGEKVKAQVAPLDRPHDRGRQNRGINAAVRDLGIDRTEAQRAVRIASIVPEAKDAARAAGLDNNQTKLLSIARAPAAEQVAKVAEIAERLAVKPSPPPLNDIETVVEFLAARLSLPDLHRFGELIAGICEPLSRGCIREAA